MKKSDKIYLELSHYINKDYECKDSVLQIKLIIDDKEEYIELKGIPAEATFGLVKEIINSSNERVKEHNEL